MSAATVDRASAILYKLRYLAMVVLLAWIEWFASAGEQGVLLLHGNGEKPPMIYAFSPTDATFTMEKIARSGKEKFEQHFINKGHVSFFLLVHLHAPPGREKKVWMGQLKDHVQTTCGYHNVIVTLVGKGSKLDDVYCTDGDSNDKPKAMQLQSVARSQANDGQQYWYGTGSLSASDLNTVPTTINHKKTCCEIPTWVHPHLLGLMLNQHTTWCLVIYAESAL